MYKNVDIRFSVHDSRTFP